MISDIFPEQLDGDKIVEHQHIKLGSVQSGLTYYNRPHFIIAKMATITPARPITMGMPQASIVVKDITLISSIRSASTLLILGFK